MTRPDTPPPTGSWRQSSAMTPSCGPCWRYCGRCRRARRMLSWSWAVDGQGERGHPNLTASRPGHVGCGRCEATRIHLTPIDLRLARNSYYGMERALIGNLPKNVLI